DSETANAYVRARTYRPAIGVWLAQDPAGFPNLVALSAGPGGDVNLYRYVGNNPGNGVDPSGLLCTVCKITPVFGGVTANQLDKDIAPPPTPYRDLLEYAKSRMAGAISATHLVLPTITGPGAVVAHDPRLRRPGTRPSEAARFVLFYITFDICELPPSRC